MCKTVHPLLIFEQLGRNIYLSKLDLILKKCLSVPDLGVLSQVLPEYIFLVRF